MALVALALAGNLPRLFRVDPADGQMSKQAVAAEMIRGFAHGETPAWISMRHFGQPVFPVPSSWVEECPLYTWTASLGCRLFGWSEVFSGRLLSLLGFGLLLGAFFRLGGLLEKEGLPDGRWVLTAIAASMPIFQIYGFSVMPDLWMTTLIAWAVVLAFDEAVLLSAALIALAGLIKYYAAFSALGLAIFVSLRRWMAKEPERPGLGALVEPFVLYGAATLPAVGYLSWVLTRGIPNPITEYRRFAGQAHFGSLSRAISPHFWMRVVLWNFIKGPGLVAGILAAVGIFQARRHARSFGIFLAAFGVAGLFFAAVFAPAYFVHDYYAIQTQVAVALCAALGLSAAGKRTWLVGALLVGVAVTGFARTSSDTIPQPFYAGAAKLIRDSSEPSQKGVLISDRAGDVAFFLSERTGWVISPDQWEKTEAFRIAAEDRLRNVETAWAGLLLVGDDAEARAGRWQAELKGDGWALASDTAFPPASRKVPPARFWLFKRTQSLSE